MRTSALRIAVTLAALAALPAGAQPIDSKTASKQVFGDRGQVTVADLDWITKDVKKGLEAYAKSFEYYAAIAVGTGAAAEAGAAMAAGNLHSLEAAQRVALRQCEAQRAGRGGACVIVATVTPRGYKPRSFSLSQGASRVLKKEFRRMDAPKAMAISPATGAFNIARGDGGRALSGCNATAAAKGAEDCRVVVFDQ